MCIRDSNTTTTTTSGHPFNVQEKTAATTGLFKTQGGPLNNTGDKLLMFTTENYNGTVEYFCTSHENDTPNYSSTNGMKKDFALTAQATTAGYDALVDSDRHIEIGHNIRLEIEGEEIIL